MKNKKFLLILITAILIIPASIIFTACSLFGGNGNNNNNNKQISAIVIKYENGTEKSPNNNDIDLGNFEYGSTNKPDLNFDLVVKYSDGSQKTLKENEFTIKYELNGYEIEDLPIFEQSEVGYYSINVTYKEKTIRISYNVEKSNNVTYTPVLSKYEWEYGVNNPEPTISNYTGTEELSYSYLKYDEYLKIKDDFKLDKVILNTYSKEVNIEPGKYVLFASVPATDKYYAKISEIVEFEIIKGTSLKVDSIGTVNINDYNYFGEFGKIKISQISIFSDDIIVKDAKGQIINGRLEWKNPDEPVDSNSTGLKSIMFVDNDNFYEPIFIKYVNIEEHIHKGVISVPEIPDTEIEYTGNDRDIYLNNYSDNMYYTIKLNGVEVSVDIFGKIGVANEIGTYTITLELKDKDNYIWETKNNAENIIITLIVKEEV